MVTMSWEMWFFNNHLKLLLKENLVKDKDMFERPLMTKGNFQALLRMHKNTILCQLLNYECVPPPNLVTTRRLHWKRIACQ